MRRVPQPANESARRADAPTSPSTVTSTNRRGGRVLNTGVLTRLHSIVGAPARRKESGRASSPPRGIPSDGAGRLEQLVEPALLVELHDAAEAPVVAAAGVDAVDPDSRD